MVVDTLIKGGLERRMLELIKALSKDTLQYDIYLISLTNKVEYDYVYDLPIKFEALERKGKKDFSLLGKLWQRVTSFNPDIIHSWGSMASVFLAPIVKFKKIRFVNGYIGQAPLKVSLNDPFYIRGLFTFPISDAIVSNSLAGLSAYRTPVKKSFCIYNGIDFERFQNLNEPSEVKEDLFGSNYDKSFLVAMVAAFEERKDYHTFIRVAIKICKQNLQTKFLLVGGGENLEAIKALVPKEFLNKNIYFLGKRSDIESILQIIDIGVLLTNSTKHGEGVSNSIIEYMASSKPVIATLGGGTNEVVENGKNGFLVDYAAEEQIIDKIKYLLANKTVSHEMGRAGYQTVRNKFSIETMRDNYIRLYNETLSNKRNKHHSYSSQFELQVSSHS
ncbi:glycosyltransferase family 4 protein [Pontibacter locisalis]|uniref:Glycosyltransferase family 4 protein n=1 Tax=Pontibacter locisalis TaxID=1719035 RepID=A0ABW5IQT5_9BACT